MNKLLLSIMSAIIIALASPISVGAWYDMAETSSNISTQVKPDISHKEVVLKSFLESYNSPLTDYAEVFIKTSEVYDIDWRLVVSITGVESTFGKRIPVNSYNAYGWANGNYRFESWEDSIDHVTKTLKNKYIDKGADSVYKIGRIYAPPSPTWGNKVEFFMNKIDPIPLSFDL